MVFSKNLMKGNDISHTNSFRFLEISIYLSLAVLPGGLGWECGLLYHAGAVSHGRMATLLQNSQYE